ncbi:hypothetical protein F4776DRAFT_476280 [Hypoxylon sp. NC0597]|nr:hypothetical protein F4776DRAFT_476280 [Hypoxylon sp. NC0597]
MAHEGSRWRFRPEDYPDTEIDQKNAGNYNLLLYLPNLTEGEDPRPQASLAAENLINVGVDFPSQHQQVQIRGNEAAKQLIRDYDHVISLGTDLVTGFDINDNDNTVRPDLPAHPRDRQWVTDALLELASYNWINGAGGQKVALPFLLDYARQWQTLRIRLFLKNIRDDWLLKGAQTADKERRAKAANSEIHMANLRKDVVMANESKGPFREKARILFNVDDIGVNFQEVYKPLFTRFYRLRPRDAQLLRNFAEDTTEPANLANIFRWLVNYVDRYCVWRMGVINLIEKFIKFRKNVLHKSRWYRRLSRVDDVYNRFFLRYLRRLIKQRHTLKRIRARTWVLNQYKSAIGDGRQFPNFNLGDVDIVGENLGFPDLEDQSRPENDPGVPHPWPERIGYPGGLGGPAGPGEPGGQGGLCGPGGPG